MKVAQLCLTFCNPMDYTVHVTLQTRILEWVAFPCSRGPAQPGDQNQVSCLAGRFFTSWAAKEAPRLLSYYVYNTNSSHQPEKTFSLVSLKCPVARVRKSKVKTHWWVLFLGHLRGFTRKVWGVCVKMMSITRKQNSFLIYPWTGSKNHT